MTKQEFFARLNKPTETVKCSVCGKTIEVPKLYLDRERAILKPYCCAGTVFIEQYLIHEGWHIRDLGPADRHPYFCPDCWEGGTPEISRRPYCDDWYKQSHEWLKKKETNETK